MNLPNEIWKIALDYIDDMHTFRTLKNVCQLFKIYYEDNIDKKLSIEINSSGIYSYIGLADIGQITIFSIDLSEPNIRISFRFSKKNDNLDSRFLRKFYYINIADIYASQCKYEINLTQFGTLIDTNE